MSLFWIALGALATALVAPWVRRFAGGAAGWLLAIVPVSFVVGLFGHLPVVSTGETVRHAIAWIPTFGLTLGFTLDGLGLLFALIISGIGAIIAIYAGAYLRNDPNSGRFYTWLFFFMGAMLGLVLSDNLLTLFVFWELTSISSFLLIGYKHEYTESRKAALQALLVTAGGGLAMLAGFVLLGQIAGTYEIAGLLEHAAAIAGHPLYLPTTILILIGAFTKSAQFPFHFWLPNAMAAPTPVSAYLHSATMVKAGVFLIAKMTPILGGTSEWQAIVVPVGAVTMLLGAIMALPQTDLKRILAYTTVSALGTLTMMLGVGTEYAIKAALVFLLVHALYKGALFLVAGSIDINSGTRDINRLGKLARLMPITAVAAVLSSLSMAGIPPLFGFIGKELLYEASLTSGGSLLWLVMGVATNAIMVWLAVVLGWKLWFGRADVNAAEPSTEGTLGLWGGPVLLAMLGLTLGLVPGLLSDSLIGPAATAVLGTPQSVKLAIWHGVNTALLLSIATIALGVLGYAARGFVDRPTAVFRRLLAIGPESIWERGFAGLLTFGKAQARFWQNGYLRYYLITILLTATALIIWTFVRDGGAPITWDISTAPFYAIAVGVVVLVAAGFAVFANTRLAAVAAVGVVGYGVALYYVLFSAPDLAITQILIETLTVILIVLVVYRLPRFRTKASLTVRWRDGLIALVAGGTMTALVLQARAVQLQPTISSFFGESAWTEAFGRNVVNVILVDFRALDTFGEIVVLAVAALGVVALLRFASAEPSP